MDKCNAFITAARFMEMILAKETSTGDTRVVNELTLIQGQRARAEQFRMTNNPSALPTQARGVVRGVSFNNFRY